VLGSIFDLGGRYVIGLHAIACGSGDTLGSEQREAADRAESIDRLRIQRPGVEGSIRSRRAIVTGDFNGDRKTDVMMWRKGGWFKALVPVVDLPQNGFRAALHAVRLQRGSRQAYVGALAVRNSRIPKGLVITACQL
jgi:hypothetical protein